MSFSKTSSHSPRIEGYDWSGDEWQCVELVNRLYLTKRWTNATWYGNGNTLVNNVPNGLIKQNNGSISYVNPGDVITLNGYTYGHAGIINTIDSNGTLHIKNQNADLDSSVYISSGSLSSGNATYSMAVGTWTGYSVQAIIHHPNTATWGGVGSATYSGGHSMASGTTLLPNYYLTSANVQHALVFQTDSNLVLYSGNGTVLWQSGTGGQNANRLVMQTDGNLVMYRANNSVVWQSGTGGHSGSYANLQSDGNFVVRDSGTAYWWTGTGGHPNLTYFGSDRLNGTTGQQIIQNQYIRSADGRYALLLQTDGNAVLYGPGYHVLWQTHTTAGDHFTMQTDGNLVLYAINVARWQSGTSGNNTYAVLQTDGNFVVYSSTNYPLWYSGTNGQI